MRPPGMMLTSVLVCVLTQLLTTAVMWHLYASHTDRRRPKPPHSFHPILRQFFIHPPVPAQCDHDSAGVHLWYSPHSLEHYIWHQFPSIGHGRKDDSESALVVTSSAQRDGPLTSSGNRGFSRHSQPERRLVHVANEGERIIFRMT